MIEGHEPEEFQRIFTATEGNCNNLSPRKLSTAINHVDSYSLMLRPKMAAEIQLIDDGSGEFSCFGFDHDMSKKKLSSEPPTCFLTTESYVIHYTLPSVRG